VLDERAHNAEVAGNGAGVQRRGALRVGGANVGAAFEKKINTLRSTIELEDRDDGVNVW
jgi:hypothetical protein